jgi:hypothetical protein
MRGSGPRGFQPEGCVIPGCSRPASPWWRGRRCAGGSPGAARPRGGEGLGGGRAARVCGRPGPNRSARSQKLRAGGHRWFTDPSAEAEAWENYSTWGRAGEGTIRQVGPLAAAHAFCIPEPGPELVQTHATSATPVRRAGQGGTPKLSAFLPVCSGRV